MLALICSDSKRPPGSSAKRMFASWARSVSRLKDLPIEKRESYDAEQGRKDIGYSSACGTSDDRHDDWDVEREGAAAKGHDVVSCFRFSHALVGPDVK